MARYQDDPTPFVPTTDQPVLRIDEAGRRSAKRTMRLTPSEAEHELKLSCNLYGWLEQELHGA